MHGRDCTEFDGTLADAGPDGYFTHGRGRTGLQLEVILIALESS